MSQYTMNLESGIRPFAIVWILFLLIYPLVSGAAETELPNPAIQTPRILVLDNCDSNYKSPPFNDVVLLLNNKGKIVNHITGLNISQNIGGNRAISVSEDGSFFVVCENVADKITAYDLSTGIEMWSLSGKFRSVAIAKNLTYVLSSSEDDKMYRDEIVTIDSEGNIIKHSKEVEGFDISIDPNANCLWVVGGDIKKCDMNLNVVKMIDPITWCAVSVDICTDSSIWVAEREHIEVAGSQNRLLNISPKGNILQSIPLNDLSPLCVRVNKSNGCVWVTGIRSRIGRRLTFRQWPPWRRTYRYIGPRTQKYSSGGKLLFEIKRGGNSIDVEPSDDSVWIADRTQILHYSPAGKKLDTCNEVSDDSKWIAVVK